MAHFRPDLGKGFLNALEDIDGLGVGIAGGVQLAARLHRRGAGHKDERAHPFGPGIGADFFKPAAS